MSILEVNLYMRMSPTKTSSYEQFYILYQIIPGGIKLISPRPSCDEPYTYTMCITIYHPRYENNEFYSNSSTWAQQGQLLIVFYALHCEANRMLKM